MELISECFIKPKHEVEASKNRIFLNPAEIIMLSIYPIQKGLLYTFDIQSTSSSYTLINNLLDNLKNSISIALLHFYPFAGRFVTETFPDEHSCAVFIDCNKGPGARLTHVTAKHLNISDLLSPTRVPSIVRELFDLGEECSINYDGHTKPLLSIQVTELVDGVFIGFTVNHSVVDGISFMHFLSMLSEIFCSNSKNEKSKISRVPVYVHGPVIKLPYLDLKKVMTRHETGPLTDRVFHFSSNSLATIKAKAANSDNGCIQNNNVSSFQSLVSLIWRSITRARNQSPEQDTICSVAVNIRTRVEPPLSNDYIGNYVMHVKVICKVGELLSHDLGYAANLLNDAIRAKDSKSIHDDFSMITDLISTPGFLCSGEDDVNVHGSKSIVIGGSMRFDMYRLEFGLGKPIAIRMGPGNKTDGKVNASQGCEEGGSVELEISLKEEHMTALEADDDFMTFVS